MNCDYFVQNLCRSCAWLNKSYDEQLRAKETNLRQLFSELDVEQWLPAVASPTSGFRNKAKMVVSGTVDQPLLGILDEHNHGLDLSRCPLYAPHFFSVFETLKQFIRKAQLSPYQIEKQKGELKYILLTYSRSRNAWMLRFVLRSDKLVQNIQQRLTWLQGAIADLLVVSVNIQPEHKAVIEGEHEIVLTQNSALPETLNGIPLYISPRSFFQTNTAIAEKLYATAGMWSREQSAYSVWDLFCGIGGFGLHCTPQDGELLGIEITPEAIASATRSAQERGIKTIAFHALDVEQSINVSRSKPDLLIVNPPRRGVGKPICDWINRLQPDSLIYSSCNAETLVHDLARLKNYRVKKIQLFDMFPHTLHYEVITLLKWKETVAE